jgi:hypothetical protein
MGSHVLVSTLVLSLSKLRKRVYAQQNSEKKGAGNPISIGHGLNLLPVQYFWFFS